MNYDTVKRCDYHIENLPLSAVHYRTELIVTALDNINDNYSHRYQGVWIKRILNMNNYLHNVYTRYLKKKKIIVCFTSYVLFSMAVLPHSPGVVYCHLLLRRETRISGVAPFSFSNRNLGSFCA